MNYSDLEKLRISASLTTNAAEFHGLISSRLCFGIDNFEDLTLEDSSDDRSVTSIQIQEFNDAFLKMLNEVGYRTYFRVCQHFNLDANFKKQTSSDIWKRKEFKGVDLR